MALKEINRARGAVFDRDEIEQPVPDGADLRRLEPGPVRDRLSNLLHPDAEIAPLFTIRNRRAAYKLSHPDHPRGLVEMAFDPGLIRDMLKHLRRELKQPSRPAARVIEAVGYD